LYLWSLSSEITRSSMRVENCNFAIFICSIYIRSTSLTLCLSLCRVLYVSVRSEKWLTAIKLQNSQRDCGALNQCVTYGSCRSSETSELQINDQLISPQYAYRYVRNFDLEKFKIATSLCSASRQLTWPRGTARICCYTITAVQQSIEISCMPWPHQRTHSNGVRRPNDGTDGQTETDWRPRVT